MGKTIGRCARLFFVGMLALGLSARAAGVQATDGGATKGPQLSAGLFDPQSLLTGPERRRLVDDIYEYTYRLQVGPGKYDVIGLHRVVRELYPYRPAVGLKGVFMVHGDIWGFRGAFLASAASESVPTQQSVAIYLAKRNVDVWGIDLRWVSVPPEEEDFTFMKDWNLGTHAQDVGVGLGFARFARLLSLNGAGPMTLMGWSRGAAISYAYLNMEAQTTPDKHQVSGFIPVDMAYMFDPKDSAQRTSACAGYTLLSGLQKGGLYEGGALGQTLQNVGAYANSAPQVASPYVAGFTNKQAALFMGASTYAIQGVPVIQSYHFTGGVFSGIQPTGLSYTSVNYFLDVLEQASSFQSIGEQVDTLALWCGSPAVPYNNHLRQVTVPVLYLGAAGGTGRYGLYTLTQLGSKDITAHIIQLQDPKAVTLDFGHLDLFTASNADTQVWPFISSWLDEH